MIFHSVIDVKYTSVLCVLEEVRRNSFSLPTVLAWNGEQRIRNVSQHTHLHGLSKGVYNSIRVACPQVLSRGLRHAVLVGARYPTQKMDRDNPAIKKLCSGKRTGGGGGPR